MKEAMVKISIYGDPVITELSYDDEKGLVVFQVVVTGVPVGGIDIKAADDYMSISLDQKSSVTDPFAITLHSDALKFRNFEFQKEYGLLTLYFPVRKPEVFDLEPIVVSL